MMMNMNMDIKKTRTVPLAVVALGGNAISRAGQEGNIKEQFENLNKSMHYIVDLISTGYRVIITHGNGPQVGNVLRRVEAAINIVYPIPLDLCGAHTEGGIGYMIQQVLCNKLKYRGINLVPATIITQTLVDKNDPAFINPTKPIGPFFSEDQMREKSDRGKWAFREDAGRGYRRVVPSPRPKKILEEVVIKRLADLGYPVIACGGGGVPVIEESGELKGVEAVIDKDLATSLLARDLKADLLIITTSVEKVSLNFKKPDEQFLDCITAAEAKRYLDEGHFSPGSMAPKIEAAIEFTTATGKPTVITLPDTLIPALARKTGTWIVS
jgi:carbamate kinase